MEFTHIRSLLSVADHGKIGDAASALGISQSGLTRRVQLLEESLGCELVERSGRGIVLTEMGRLVVERGRSIVERVDTLTEDVARHVRLEAGVVRIGGGATAVSYLLPRQIAAFRRKNPGVRFEVREAGSRDVEQSVLGERIELGVVTLPVQSKELVVRTLMTDRIVLVAAAGHPLAKMKRVPLSALKGESLVGFEAGTKLRSLIDTALGKADVTMNVVAELRSIAAILRMAETTGSMAFVSSMGTEGTQVLSVPGLKVERQLALISRGEKTLSPAARSFADALWRSAQSKKDAHCE